jgi:hypothetical protein
MYANVCSDLYDNGSESLPPEQRKNLEAQKALLIKESHTLIKTLVIKIGGITDFIWNIKNSLM